MKLLVHHPERINYIRGEQGLNQPQDEKLVALSPILLVHLQWYILFHTDLWIFTSCWP